MATNSPTALRWWFAVAMRRLREAAGISREAAAQAIRGSVSAIAHIENGRSLPKPLELESLLALYGVVERAEAFQRLRERARKGKDWFVGFEQHDVPEDFGLFLGMESSASQLEGWDAQVVAGAFQTRRYAEATIRGAEPDLSEDEVARRVDLRMARQRMIFEEGEPPLVWRVVASTALEWEVGGKDVLREQLLHLADLADRPGIKLQVLPTTVGAHTGVEGTFTILSAPPELEDYPGCVYAETLVKPYYYEELEQIRKYRNALTELRIKASKPEKTSALFRQLAKEL
ncbi:helix-turn-helix domain-containing protein [Amycolatopsis alba]|uniref:XRE family transcriptional regulator n=1 Tax=Amycolatopsis alba DSM 44262 TaxID=1125972 RepID=A0A229R909_AMYAL|nr:helix-turn-helix transcriptional regulator [Amycolatopsis alba]OXM43128.1 XRE family transcriptional regulator [Amycolatopsis alba DSM 44262]